jgi:large subunit ribosomal protein L25
VLLQQLSEVEVEALPEELPENIEVSVEPLAAIDEQITVGDLKVESGVTILTDAGQIVVKIAEPVQEEPEEPVAEEGAEGEGAEAADEGETGEGKAEGETTDTTDAAKEE